MKIILIGMMGSAKSTVGQLLAAEFRWVHLDLDNLIEEQTGQAIHEIFALRGEGHFRQLESEAMLALSRSAPPAVISLGGGAILNKEAMDALRKTGKVIYLRASPSHLAMRLELSTEKRPLLMDAPDQLLRLTEILAVRRSIYEGYADLILDSDEKTSAILVEEILRWCKSVKVEGRIF